MFYVTNRALCGRATGGGAVAICEIELRYASVKTYLVVLTVFGSPLGSGGVSRGIDLAACGITYRTDCCADAGSGAVTRAKIKLGFATVLAGVVMLTVFSSPLGSGGVSRGIDLAACGVTYRTDCCTDAGSGAVTRAKIKLYVTTVKTYAVVLAVFHGPLVSGDVLAVRCAVLVSANGANSRRAACWLTVALRVIEFFIAAVLTRVVVCAVRVAPLGCRFVIIHIVCSVFHAAHCALCVILTGSSTAGVLAFVEFGTASVSTSQIMLVAVYSPNVVRRVVVGIKFSVFLAAKVTNCFL